MRPGGMCREPTLLGTGGELVRDCQAGTAHQWGWPSLGWAVPGQTQDRGRDDPGGAGLNFSWSPWLSQMPRLVLVSLAPLRAGRGGERT